MKTVQNVVTNEVKRLPDGAAKLAVESNDGWKYVAKKIWKALRPKPAAVETPAAGGAK